MRKNLTIAVVLALAMVFLVGAGSVFAAPFQDTGQPLALSPLGASDQLGPIGARAFIASAPNAATGIDPGQIALVSAAISHYICAPTQSPEVLLNRDHLMVVSSATSNIVVCSGSSTPRQMAQTMTRMSDLFIGTYVAYDVPQDRGSPGLAPDLAAEPDYTRSYRSTESTVLRC